MLAMSSTAVKQSMPAPFNLPSTSPARITLTVCIFILEGLLVLQHFYALFLWSCEICGCLG